MSSYYEGLPIYKAAADLAVLLDRVVRGFSRYHKYALGAKLRDASIELVVLVARCNGREERARWLAVLCGRIEELKILVDRRRWGAGAPWPRARSLVRQALELGYRVVVALEVPRTESVGPILQRRLAWVIEPARRVAPASKPPSGVFKTFKTFKTFKRTLP